MWINENRNKKWPKLISAKQGRWLFWSDRTHCCLPRPELC